MWMADQSRDAEGQVVKAADGALPVTGNPIVDGVSRLLLFLGSLLDPQLAPRTKCPAQLNDEELREAACRVAIALVDELGLIVQEGSDGTPAEDPSWHRPWPTTVEAFIRSTFMSGFDAFGTVALSLGMNTSVASTSNVRAAAQCHVLMRWVLDADTDAEQRSRVLAMTRASIDKARSSLANWEHATPPTQGSGMIAYVRQALDAAESDVDALISEHGLNVPPPPDRESLFDRYLPRGYATFAMTSDVGSPSGPSPFFFYGDSDFSGESETGTPNWDYLGLHVERAFWIAQACRIQLDNYQLAAPVCGWVNHEHVLKLIADELALVDAEAEKRFTTRRDPGRIWM